MLEHIFPPHLVTAMMRRKPLLQTMQSMAPTSPESSPKSASGGGTGGEGGKSKRVGLKRSLTLFDLILYGVGCSVGAGIYCLVGIGAQIAGPGISLSFLSCGMACVLTSLAYAEFAARIPVTGSAYTYAYIAFGEFWAWLVGWNLTLNYAFSASVVARSWAEYLASFIRSLVREGSTEILGPVDAGGIEEGESAADSAVGNALSLPWLTRMPLPIPFVDEDYTCSPLSIVIIGLCTLVLVTGAKESSRFNNIMTVLNLSMLAFVLIAGLGTDTVDSANLEPFLPEGMSGVARGAGLVFFAFIGFDMVACLSEEVKNPERNMPLGIVGSLLISTAIYVSVALVVVGMAPVDLLGGDVPITNALLANACCTHEEQLLSNANEQCLRSSCAPVIHSILLHGSRIVGFGAIFGLTTGTFTSLMGQPRIFYRMAKDGLLFRIFARVNEKTRVPTAGIIITGILCSLLACLVDLEALANLISLGTLLVFTFVDSGVIILRLSPSLDAPISVIEEEMGDSEMEEDDFPHAGPPMAPLNLDSDGQNEGSIWSDIIALFRPTRGVARTNVAENGKKPASFTVLFATCTTMGSMAITNGWFTLIPVVCMTLALLSAAVLVGFPQSAPPQTFYCPLVPIVPLLGVGCNAFMMGSLPLSSWALAVSWLCIGLAVYFLYGVKHSRLGRAMHAKRDSITECSPLCPSVENTDGRYESTLNVSLHAVHDE